MTICRSSSKKKKAFTQYAKKWADETGKKAIDTDLNKIKKYCQVVRILAHTQVHIFWNTINLLSRRSKSTRSIVCGRVASFFLYFHYKAHIKTERAVELEHSSYKYYEKCPL